MTRTYSIFSEKRYCVFFVEKSWMFFLFFLIFCWRRLVTLDSQKLKCIWSWSTSPEAEGAHSLKEDKEDKDKDRHTVNMTSDTV